MASVFKTAPTPAQFAEAWAKQFEATVTAAAGRDGRLSVSEASRIADVFGDNAQAYLAEHHQKTVSPSVLVEAGRKFALEQATAAAGPDGRLSLEDAKKLDASLQADFFMLRGKGPAPAPFRTDAELKADVRQAVIDGFKNGTALKLSTTPPELTGRQ